MKCRFLFALALLCSAAAHAQTYTLGKLQIHAPWARATPAGAMAAGGFLRIENQGAADRLIEASSPVSKVTELHTMRMEGNMMRMAKLAQGIPLPAGQTTELKPGGLHVMFIDLKAPLQAGSEFPLELTFEQAGKISVTVTVGEMGAGAASGHSHH